MKKLVLGIACIMIVASASTAYSARALTGNTADLSGTVSSGTLQVLGIEL